MKTLSNRNLEVRALPLWETKNLMSPTNFASPCGGLTLRLAPRTSHQVGIQAAVGRLCLPRASPWTAPPSSAIRLVVCTGVPARGLGCEFGLMDFARFGRTPLRFWLEFLILYVFASSFDFA